MGYLRRRDTGSIGFRRLGLLFGLALVALCASVSSASASEPPPSLVTLSISPSSINTTSSSQSVKVTAEITSTPGFSTGSVGFESPNGSETTERAAFTKVSGTLNKGIWEANVTFKRYIAPGTWRVSSLNMADKEGNDIHLDSTQLEVKGFSHTVSVTSIEDNEPPQLTALSFSTARVNTTSANQTVGITAHITDNLSGVAAASIVFRSPSGTHFTDRAFFSKLSGTDTNGTYEAKVTFKRFIEPGPWKVSALHLVDNVENEATLGAKRLEAKGFPDTIQVESIEDEEPPALAGLSFSSSAVDTTASSQSVTVEAHITDNLSGVESAAIVFESPSGKQTTGKASFTKVSGTETDGMYEATVTFKQFIQSGTWKVRAVNLEDNVGNEANVTASQLESKGLPATVHVVSNEDTQPPALGAFSIVPSTVNTESSPQTVTVTAEITDNLSGFSQGTVVFESPSGKVITNVAQFTKVSGTALKGTYEAKIIFKQFIQPGTWKVSNVTVGDAVGNEENISASQLEGKGFPATVKVASIEDTEAPVLTGLSITPMTIDTATSNAVVIVTAHITDNLSGFRIGFVGFESENGKHQTGQAAFNVKISGTETNGTYETVVTFKQSLESGTWKVRSLTMQDNSGNEASLSASQLEAKGFPAAVVDETSAPPTVRKVTPRKGPAAGGTVVMITGTNFAEVTAVKFGGKEAIGFTVDSLNKITATSPAGTTGTVDVTVTTDNGTSATSSRDHFRYAAPTVTGVTPNHGPKSGGTKVTITGTGFDRGSSGTSVKFGMAMASSVHCSSKTSCTAIAPASSKIGTISVIVTVAGKRSSNVTADRYTYT
jgi:hypothetical protein